MRAQQAENDLMRWADGQSASTMAVAPHPLLPVARTPASHLFGDLVKCLLPDKARSIQMGQASSSAKLSAPMPRNKAHLSFSFIVRLPAQCKIWTPQNIQTTRD